MQGNEGKTKITKALVQKGRKHVSKTGRGPEKIKRQS